MGSMQLNDQPTFIDFFAGCGGLSLGLEQAGFYPLYVNELNSDARETSAPFSLVVFQEVSMSRFRITLTIFLSF